MDSQQDKSRGSEEAEALHALGISRRVECCPSRGKGAQGRWYPELLVPVETRRTQHACKTSSKGC